MYSDDWLFADHVVCTPPSAEHLVAAGILAWALGSHEPRSGNTRPAPVQVVAPTSDARSLLERWAAAARRPVLWVIALDAATLPDLTSATAVAWVTQRGGRVLIGPDDVEPDPVRLVAQHLKVGVGYPLQDHWQTLVKSAERRTLLIRRALLPDSEVTTSAKARKDQWQALAIAAALTVNQARGYADAWNTGGRAWDHARTALGIHDDRWYSPLIHALRAIDQDPQDSVWLTQIIGFSATTHRLRAQARAATEALRSNRPVWLVAHDPHEAQRLGNLIHQVAEGTTAKITTTPSAPLPTWDPAQRKVPVSVVPVAHEAAAYHAAAPAGAHVVDVPPLDERSMDIPHIALDLLGRLHRSAGRPGAPRVGIDTPDQLDWMRTCWWDGTGGLSRWLSDHLQRDPSGDWLHEAGEVPPHPGLDAGACLGVSMTLDSVVAQTVRWALGAHSQQKVALQRLGIGTSRLPACLHDTSARPRRLQRRQGEWTDPWFPGGLPST